MNERKRAARRASPIHAYCGPNGSGKSLAMVNDTIPSMQAGRRVLSTIPLFLDGEPYEHCELLTDWSQLLEAEHADVLLDEIVGSAGSRESMGLPVQVQARLVQLRRRDLHLRWTAPQYARADRIIRECTQAVTECRGYFSDGRSQREAAKGSGGVVKAWTPKRLFRFATYSATDFVEWTDGKRQRLAAEQVEWFWGPKSEAFASYDTMGAVERVGEVLDSGRCVNCGGRRPVPACSCEDAPPRRARQRLVLADAPEGDAGAIAS